LEKFLFWKDVNVFGNLRRNFAGTRPFDKQLTDKVTFFDYKLSNYAVAAVEFESDHFPEQ